MEGFVLMEDEKARALVAHVDSALAALKKVLYGAGLLTPQIQATASALLKAEVPRSWEDRWEGPEKPQAWLRELLRRKRALLGWCEDVGSLLRRPLDLSELFHPGTFLNALRQQTARRMGCSMDGLKLISCWKRGGLRKFDAKEVCEVQGLLIQGASFDGKALADAEANASELCELDSGCCVSLAFVPKEERGVYAEDQCIGVPLYFDTARQRVLDEIALPINDDQQRWVMAGVALFLAE